jgi:hypothetical protein
MQRAGVHSDEARGGMKFKPAIAGFFTPAPGTKYTDMQKAIAAHLIPTELLTPFEGGFFAGLFKQGGETRALIVSGKEGNLEGVWGEYGQDVSGARSYTDGLANTIAMAEAGSELAKQALMLEIGGFTDWAIPARDQLELLYRHFKPTTRANSCSFRDGDNTSSLPLGYPYTEQSPTQTAIEGFREGDEHALQAEWYWASTQFSSSRAWIQSFTGGGTTSTTKENEARVRAVRTIHIIH